MQSFILELFLSFLLMLVILHVACGSKENGLFNGIIIGGIVGLEAMFAGPVCGASMNPARSLGPALVSDHIEFLWLYLIAPLTGMTLAVPLFKFVKEEVSHK
jgi:aquaporin Z